MNDYISKIEKVNKITVTEQHIIYDQENKQTKTINFDCQKWNINLMSLGICIMLSLDNKWKQCLWLCLLPIKRS